VKSSKLCSVWLNPPFADIEEAVRWVKSLELNVNSIYMLIPEWISIPELESRCKLKVKRQVDITLPADKTYEYPNGDKRVISYGTKIVEFA
jgi:hypothetical protein